jgi:heme oxygenase
LREGTHDAHRAVEAHPHQRVLLTAPLDPGFLRSMLLSMRSVHGALEHALERAATTDPRVAAMFAAHHRRSAGIDDDLADLDETLRPTDPPACVARYTDDLARAADDPPTLVGHWYVFEGATNGGRYLEPRVRAALGADAPLRIRTFDPYGPEQAARWTAFRDGLAAFDTDADTRRRCLDGARAAFAFHLELFDARLADGTALHPRS